MYTKTKTVNFSLRNDSSSELKVSVGEDEVILYPGRAVAIKLAIGERVVAAQDSPKYSAGTVLVAAESQPSDATIVLH